MSRARLLVRRVPSVTWGIALLAVMTAYYVAEASSFHLFVLNTCLLAVIGAVALNLLMGTAGLVSIGNSAFMAVGAFTAVWAIKSGLHRYLLRDPLPVEGQRRGLGRLLHPGPLPAAGLHRRPAVLGMDAPGDGLAAPHRGNAAGRSAVRAGVADDP